MSRSRRPVADQDRLIGVVGSGSRAGVDLTGAFSNGSGLLLAMVRYRTVGIVVEPILDHLERQEVLPLLAQHPTQSLDVMLVELAVARGRPFGVTSPWLSRKRIFEMVTSGNSWRSRVRTSPIDRYDLELTVVPRCEILRALSLSLARRHQIQQLELSDLHFVAAGQPRFVDPLAVHIGAVERTHVPDGCHLIPRHKLRMPTGHGDVIEEDVALGMPTGPGEVGLEHEPDALVRTALDHEHPHAAGQLQ